MLNYFAKYSKMGKIWCFLLLLMRQSGGAEIGNSQGNWTPDLSHDLAGGVIRVSGDGLKPEVPADPLLEIGTASPITEEMITSHPNYNYLSPLSECGLQKEAGQEQGKDDVLLVSLKFLDGIDPGKNEVRRKRIIGGRHVDGIQSHPWMVQLYLLNIGTNEHFFHCAGTLISNSTVLTAAHCLTRISPGTSLDVAVVGNNDRRNITFCDTSDPRENCSRSFIRTVEDVEVHIAYSEGNLNHDIGLIYLQQPVQVGPNIRPICLPYSTSLLENWDNVKLKALGWGSTNKFTEGYNSDILKQVEIDLQERALCDKFHVRIYGRTMENRICSGGNAGRGTCNGDSGGGLTKKLRVPKLDGEERIFQFGIISAGGHVTDTCGFQGRPTIETNVLYYMEWILNHVAPGVLSYKWVTGNRGRASWIPQPGVAEESPSSQTRASWKSISSPFQFVNEFSTGYHVDVTGHPNLKLLPSLLECGNSESMKNNREVDGVPVLKRVKRVIGGVPTGLDSYLPWMAQIYVRNVETNEVALRCAGTIISKRHILTAAHCVTEVLSPYSFDGVIVGQYNRNSTSECFDDTCFSPVRVKISDVVVHLEYEKYTHKNNIALVRLAQDLKFTRMVQPICLPRREILTNGINILRFFTAGWGRVLRDNANERSESRLSEILLQIHVDLLQRRDCDFVYSRAVDMLDRSRLCGGGKASSGECTGDGGAPLMKKFDTEANKQLNNKVFQLGIVSFTDCGMEGMPTIYQNIIFYMNWILNNLPTGDEGLVPLK